jgi:hypothetical protein
MSILTMNQFRITKEDGTSVDAVYVNIAQAAAAFDDELNPVTQVVRTRVGIQVGVPDEALTVTFRTLIAGSGAETAGCRATPTTYGVLDGSAVIFEAYAAEGYNFIGWFIGEDTSGTPESTSEIASIAINATIGVSQDVIITALFAPVS